MKVIAKEYFAEHAEQAQGSNPIFRDILKLFAEKVDESVIIEREQGIMALGLVLELSQIVERKT